MGKRISIYHLIIAVLMFSLIIPGAVGAQVDDPIDGTLTIHKYEQEPGTEPGEAGDGSSDESATGTPLQGVTYKVTQTHAYDGEDWTAVTDGQVYELVTNEDGVVSQVLPLGRYTVGEISGPDHVHLNPDIFTIDIPMTSKDGSTLNYDVHIYPKNETIRGAVQVIKTDGDSEVALGGVQFKLYNADGTLVENIGETIFHTNDQGKIDIEGLAYGDYYFTEVETIDGYVLGSQWVDFSITTSGITVAVNIENYREPTVEKEVDLAAVNRGDIVEYSITVDLPGDIERYKSFVVTDKLHENLEYVVGSATSPTGFTVNYDENTHTLTWTGTPADLVKGTVTFTFKAKVSEEAEANVGIDNKAFIDYTNEHDQGGEKETDPVIVTPTAGSLKVIKKDKSSGEMLTGAEFELRDANGVVVETGSTNDAGELVFKSELDFGEYTLHETKAPDGYRILTKPINVTIDSATEYVVTVENSLSGWNLPTTGGIGTVLFTAIGLMLMAIALFAYFRRIKTVEE